MHTYMKILNLISNFNGCTMLHETPLTTKMFNISIISLVQSTQKKVTLAYVSNCRHSKYFNTLLAPSPQLYWRTHCQSAT